MLSGNVQIVQVLQIIKAGEDATRNEEWMVAIY